MIRAADHLPTTALPDGWSTQRLGDLVDLVNGHPFSSDDFAPDGEIPLVRIRDLSADEFEVYVPRGAVPRRAVLETGDVVVGMDGDFNVVIWERGPAALNQRLCRLRPRAGTDHRFIAYALPSLLSVVNDLTFSTTVKHLSSSDILGQRLPAPSSDEQCRIADFLDTETARHDAAIAVRDAQAGLELERWRARVANAVLNVEGRPTPLKHLFESSFAGVWGGDPGSGEVDVLCARVADFDRENYRVADVPTVRGLVAHDARRKELQHGDVLLEKSGGTHAKPVGCAVIYEGPAGTVSSNFIQVLRPAAEFIPRFIGYLMAALYETRQNGAFVHQTTGIQNLDLGAYLSSTVAVPPVEAQRLAVQELDDAREKSRSMREALRRSVSLIDERRQALITAAVTGQLDVTTARGGVS